MCFHPFPSVKVNWLCQWHQLLNGATDCLSLYIHYTHSLFTPNLYSFEANKQQVETDDRANSHVPLQNLNIFMVPLEGLPKLVWCGELLTYCQTDHLDPTSCRASGLRVGLPCSESVVIFITKTYLFKYHSSLEETPFFTTRGWGSLIIFYL